MPLEATLVKLKPLASNCREAMEKYVPPVVAMSKPSETLPDPVVSVSDPQPNCPAFQTNFPVMGLQVWSPPF